MILRSGGRVDSGVDNVLFPRLANSNFVGISCRQLDRGLRQKPDAPVIDADDAMLSHSR
jgi:hypothetical protein